MMQASKKIPFEDPQVLMGVRGLYIVSNIIIFAVYMYTKMQIDKKKGTCMSSICAYYSPPLYARGMEELGEMGRKKKKREKEKKKKQGERIN